MLTYEEATNYYYLYSCLKTKRFTDGLTEKLCMDAMEYFDTVYEKRVKITFLFPFLKYEEIVKLAYDVLNVCARKSNNNNKIFYIGSFKEYKHSLEESLGYYNKIKKQAIKKDPVHFFKTCFQISFMDIGKISEKYQVL